APPSLGPSAGRVATWRASGGLGPFVARRGCNELRAGKAGTWAPRSLSLQGRAFRCRGGGGVATQRNGRPFPGHLARTTLPGPLPGGPPFFPLPAPRPGESGGGLSPAPPSPRGASPPTAPPAPAGAPPLVLLHGVARRWQDFTPLLPALACRWQVHAL